MVRPRGGHYDERGQAAGIESVAFGIAVLLGATLLITNLWSAVGTRSALDNAAREYLRAYTAAETRADGQALGIAAVERSLGERWSVEVVTIDAPPEPFGPCRPATVTLTITKAALRLPAFGSVGSYDIAAEQRELVQPFGRAAGELAHDPDARTVCDG